MKLLSKHILGLPLFLLSSNAFATETILDLVRSCKAGVDTSAVVELTYCAGVLSGLNEMHTIYADDKLKLGKKMYCAPDTGLQNEQLIKVFIKWADEHPEDLHQRASIGFVAAMKNAFPCK